jgi:7-keto-8-aminopelargonate synthetase-like enzyme
MPRLSIESSSATHVRLDGRELSYFGGCGYLGLAHHPRVVAAFADGARRFGLSAGASRETTGNCVVYDQLELDLARRLGQPAALLTPEGYTANFVAAQALARERQVALIDERSHPSLFDAARAAQLATHAFPHGGLDVLDKQLREHGARAVVMLDGVFPTRGEIAPLRQLAQLTAEHGAALLVDDCHGTGVVGEHGRGALEHHNVRDDHVVLTSTLSKALGCYGGFVAGPQALIDAARAHSQAYIGTTPAPPAAACAALEALKLAFDNGALLEQLRQNSAQLRVGFHALGLPTPGENVPVFAFALESAETMRGLHERLRDRGIFAPYVHYLGSPSAGNFRIVVNAAHTREHIAALLDGLAGALDRSLT